VQSYSFNGGGLRAIVGVGKIGQMQGVDLGCARHLRVYTRDVLT